MVLVVAVALSLCVSVAAQWPRETLLSRLRCEGTTPKTCEHCIDRLLSLWRNGTSGGEVEWSFLLLNHLLSFHASCSAGGPSCDRYALCRAQVLRRLPLPLALEDLEGVLRDIKAVYEPEPGKPCFSAEGMMNELNSQSGKFGDMPRDVLTVLLLTSHLHSGECIDVGESVADFLDDIFLHYGDGCERVMTQSGFTKLWNDLQMQRKGRHVEHGMQKGACATSPAAFHHLDDRRGTSAPPSSDDVSSIVVLSSPENATSSDSEVYRVGNRNPKSRPARHTTDSDHRHKSLANECLPSVDLLQRFLAPGNQVITSSEFFQLCPALVQQAVSGVCGAEARRHNESTTDVSRSDDPPPPATSPWLAVASVSLITALSLVGLFLLPLLRRSFFVHVNAFFTGLAFGTMAGDVVLHIMPQYLGLHGLHQGKDEEGGALAHLFPGYLQRQLAFLLTMYLLFLVESVFSVSTGEKRDHHHGHSHNSPGDISLADLGGFRDAGDAEMKPESSRCTKIIQFLKPSNLFAGMSSKAAVIVLADTVHNFADGMAIAVGFSTSYRDGLSTSVAVFFHELPHEIGDFAILMNCGLSYWRAFAFNLLSGLSAFLGLGVGVFTATLFRDWLLCVTAGLFFFVVMAEMLPDMRLESKETWREFVVKIVGTVFGIATMICIAMYELATD